MRAILAPHPDSVCEAVSAIEVEVERTGSGLLALSYLVTGTPDGLVVPPPTQPTRTDGLWRHTCFEAFVRGPEGTAYAELNFAPSGQWAIYAFDRYRDGARDAKLAAPPQIVWTVGHDSLVLTAKANLSDLPSLPPDGPWRIGVTAVIEEAGGRISHWALAHPPGKADFHHDEGFALTLPRPRLL